MKAIVEELEEPLENIEQICIAVRKCGVEEKSLKIYEQLQQTVLDKD